MIRTKTSTTLSAALLAAIFAGTLFTVSGCDSNDGPVEEAGEQVDDAADEAQDAAEEAGDEMEEATD